MHTRGRTVRRARLAVNQLESRENPAVTAGLLNGVLTVLGDTSANNLSVYLSGGNLIVGSTGQGFGSWAVSTIAIDGGMGDDTVSVGPGITQQCWLFGGSGNDRVTSASSANDLIFGGNGDDYLDGGPGNDYLYGGAGNDSLADSQGANSANQGSPYQTAQLGTVESQIVALVNQQRAANGVAPLTFNPVLTFSAGLQSGQMAQQSTVQGISEAMVHTMMGVALPTMTSRDVYAGYEYTAVGENIAFGYSDANDVMTAWMNSPGHRANILDPGYTEIGVSVKPNPDGVLYFTQEFGKPFVPSGGTPPGGDTGGTGGTITGTPSPSLVAVGAGAGASPRIAAYDAATGALRFSFDAYASSFRGGVRVATGDVTGDGIDDIITAPGPGGGPHIQVFDGATGKVARSFFAYGATFAGGVFVAAGDVNGDGKADIITGAGAGGGPHVRVFSGATGAELAGFFAYSPSFIGGVCVAAGDVNGDGKADVVTGAGAGGGPQVRVFSGSNFTNLSTFYAYAPTFAGGVSVAVGDINGDGKADIITGAGAGGGPHVQVFSGANLSVLRSFFAYGASFSGGVCVGCADQDGDGKADLVVGGGGGASNPAKAFSGVSLSTIRNYTPFDPSFLGGCFVG